jgi:hypothetical protein
MNVLSQQQFDQDTALSLQLGTLRSDPHGRQIAGIGMLSGDFYPKRDFHARISMEKAVADAVSLISKIDTDLQITELMEFEEVFYLLVTEKESNKGAFELLVNPYSGKVSPEVGPNMMWNLKYGHINQEDNSAKANKISMADAAQEAQKELDQYIHGATLIADGVDFYGYYSFDYKENGKIAGMLSVNGQDGQVWLHNWHGTFIGEMEASK